MKKSFFPNLALILASTFFFSCATLDKLNEFSANMNKKSQVAVIEKI